MLSRRRGLRQIALPLALIACAIALVLWLLYVPASSRSEIARVSPGHFPVELWPLWRDSYKPLEEIPPWPRGATERQLMIIRGIDRMWFASLDPNPMDPESRKLQQSFHGHRVTAFREVSVTRQRDAFATVLLQADSNKGSVGWVPEGYPGHAVRLQSGEEFLDCIVELRHRLIFLLDSRDMTFVTLPKDSPAIEVLRDLCRSLPVDPNAD